MKGHSSSFLGFGGNTNFCHFYWVGNIPPNVLMNNAGQMLAANLKVFSESSSILEPYYPELVHRLPEIASRNQGDVIGTVDWVYLAVALGSHPPGLKLPDSAAACGNSAYSSYGYHEDAVISSLAARNPSSLIILAYQPAILLLLRFCLMSRKEAWRLMWVYYGISYKQVALKLSRKLVLGERGFIVGIYMHKSAMERYLETTPNMKRNKGRASETQYRWFLEVVKHVLGHRYSATAVLQPWQIFLLWNLMLQEIIVGGNEI